MVEEKKVARERRITVGTVAVGEGGKKRVMEALARGRISGGKFVQEFEEAFAAYHGLKYGIAVSTGTDADAVAVATLLERGGRRGDEVILPALTFISVANAVLHAGLVPRFADINADSYNLEPAAAEAAISPRTRAVMAVHNFGRPAPMGELAEVAARHGLMLIEDAAEAHGARYRGKLVGTFGAMAAYSFYVAHILTTGEGGMVITDDDELARLCRSLRAHGRACDCKVCVLNVDSSYCPLRYKYGDDTDIRFHFERVGFSSKMNELEAALGVEQVEKMDDIVRARRERLDYFNRHLARHEEFLKLFRAGPGEEISPLCYPLVVQREAPFERFELTKYLEQRGVETRPAFGCVPTQQPAYKWMGHREGEFPAAEHVGARGFYIGCHQNITDEDAAYVVAAFDEFMKKY
ncbi:MAG: aminotransferase class I/II-fold pyridoxal phosphate-dependent enzyme [candidate division Zixibacteria bacterium]|nr:aminotransferase class I/II-fold pyridoxal phosphate-dependent enzyme [candidate division Zixibacteria bacterium]